MNPRGWIFTAVAVAAVLAGCSSPEPAGPPQSETAADPVIVTETCITG